MDNQLTTRQGRAVAAVNRQRLKRINWNKYPNIAYYLRVSELQPYTLRTRAQRMSKLAKGVYMLAENLEVLRYGHQYSVMISYTELTHDVLHKRDGILTSVKQCMAMLCAMGFFVKDPQYAKTGQVIPPNAQFLKKTPKAKQAKNVYVFRRLTDEVLEEIDERAELLRERGINAGNISNDTLITRDLPPLAEEVYPLNSRRTWEIKEEIFWDFCTVLDFGIEQDGYCTRDLVKACLPDFTDYRIGRMLKVFGTQLEQRYVYKRPKKAQKQAFGIDPDNNTFIYTKREENKA